MPPLHADPSANQGKLIFGSVDLAPIKLGEQTLVSGNRQSRALVNKSPIQ